MKYSKILIIFFVVLNSSCLNLSSRKEFTNYKEYYRVYDQSMIGKNPEGVMVGKISARRLKTAHVSFYFLKDNVGVVLRWKDGAIEMLVKPDGPVVDWEFYGQMPYLLVNHGPPKLKQKWEIVEWSIWVY